MSIVDGHVVLNGNSLTGEGKSGRWMNRRGRERGAGRNHI